jgi:hypothetical protein
MFFIDFEIFLLLCTYLAVSLSCLGPLFPYHEKKRGEPSTRGLKLDPPPFSHPSFLEDGPILPTFHARSGSSFIV